MNCCNEALRNIFKKANQRWPDSFRQYEHLIEYQNNARLQAKLSCLILSKLDPWFRERSCLCFLHPKKGDPHCIGITNFEGHFYRWCSYEQNWRFIYLPKINFQFSNRDWTSAVDWRTIRKPFQFSFVATGFGYSTWVQPQVLMKKLFTQNLDDEFDYIELNRWKKELARKSVSSY